MTTTTMCGADAAQRHPEIQSALRIYVGVLAEGTQAEIDAWWRSQQGTYGNRGTTWAFNTGGGPLCTGSSPTATPAPAAQPTTTQTAAPGASTGRCTSCGSFSGPSVPAGGPSAGGASGGLSGLVSGLQATADALAPVKKEGGVCWLCVAFWVAVFLALTHD